MNFSLNNTVLTGRIFIRKKNDMVSRWDPHYHSPRFADLNATLNAIGAAPIREVSENVFSGITPLSGGDAYTEELGGIAFIRSGDFNEDGTINEYSLIRLKQNVHDTLMRRSQLKSNDVLFAIVGATIGKVGIFPGGYEANINQAVCAVSLSEKVLPGFLHAFFLTRLGQEQIQRIKRPVARANINLEEVGTFRIPALSESLQKSVVNVLKKAFDQKIATETQANALLKSIDHILLDELGIPRKPELPNILENRIFQSPSGNFTGQRWDPHYHSPRFADLNAILDTIGATPIREVSENIFSGITPLSGGDAYTEEPGGIAFIRSGDFNEDNTINESSLIRLKQNVHDTLMRRSQLKSNDVLFAIVGATIGKVGIFPGGYEANINQAVCAVSLSEKVLPGFLHAFFLTRLGQEQIQRIKRPVARANINLEEVGTLRVPVPKPDRQKEIVKRLEGVREQANKLREKARADLEKAKRDIEAMILGKAATE